MGISRRDKTIKMAKICFWSNFNTCLSILSVLFKIVTFSALETSHSLACTFYEFVKVCRCFYATNENIHVLSMKFPLLFLRPEIIITFLWGWEWSGGQVRHPSPRNSPSDLVVMSEASGSAQLPSL